MRIHPTLLVLLSTNCFSQQDYEKTLPLRLEQIKQLTYYNNSIVVYSESSGYGSTFDPWDSDREFYQDEMVVGPKGGWYRALKDNVGKIPGESPNEWKLFPFTHPYFFFRDTARTEDLKALLNDTNPYVKTYAFASLANRQTDGLYDVMLLNLGDTTRIPQMTSDYGYEVCPADLMIMYLLPQMTENQKRQLLRAIKKNYPHLEYAEQQLSGR